MHGRAGVFAAFACRLPRAPAPGYRRYHVIEQRSPAAYVAEFIGTFVLVLAITLSVTLFINGQGTGSDWTLVGIVHFLVLFILVQTLGSVSGAHLNPAVTVS